MPHRHLIRVSPHEQEQELVLAQVQIQMDQIGNGPQLLDVLDELGRSPAETERGVGVQLEEDPDVRGEHTI